MLTDQPQAPGSAETTDSQMADGSQTDSGDGGDAPRGFHDLAQTPHRSPIRNYCDLVVGSRCPWAFVKYECLTSLLGFMPGAAGLALRRKLYPFLFARCGRGLVVGVGVTLRQPGRVTLGAGCVVDDYACLSVRGDEGSAIRLGKHVFVGRQSVINVRDATVEIDDFTSIGSACRLGCDGGTLRIGQYVLVAAYAYIGGGAHRTDRTDMPMALQGMDTKGGVTIEDDVWIGTRATVVDGVHIGKGSIIGAGSLVMEDVPELSVAYGSPAKVVRKREAGTR